MIYNLLVPLSTDVGVLNVFRYITFRSVWALLTALIISILFGPAMIRWLTRSSAASTSARTARNTRPSRAPRPWAAS